MVFETMNYRKVQKIAKDTIAYIRRIIEPGMSLKSVRRLCEEKMIALGADSFWYWEIGAFVFDGDDAAVSVAGREYVTSDRLVGETDIITVDLSPQVGGIWGDYARTVILENGSVVPSIREVSCAEWRAGLETERKLHERMAAFVTPETSFEELYFRMNDCIAAEGFINLDFAGNLGHSIVRRKEDRIYIEKGNKTRLGDVSCFTFEPHIGKADSKYGYKRENIYYFDHGRIREL